MPLLNAPDRTAVRFSEEPALERELVQAILANEALIALTGEARPARAALLDRFQLALRQHRARVVRVASPNDQPLDLKKVMDQVVGPGGDGGDAERVERFFDKIALPVADEQHIVLIVDDAHLLTPDMLNYLALIGPTTVGQDLRLQIVFAGTAALWDRLPRMGNLAADHITRRFAMEAPGPTPLPVPESAIVVAPPEPQPRTAAVPRPTAEAPSWRDDLPPAAVQTEEEEEGPLGLRRRLAEEYRQREQRQGNVKRLGVPMLTVFLAIVVVGSASVLWMRMPELRVAVKSLFTQAPVRGAADSAATVALVVRGNRLLAVRDIGGAQLVFAHAASGGSAAAATGLAKTYDPRFLEKIGVRDAAPDPAIAAAWYRQAISLGDKEATDLLAQMGQSASR